MTSIGIQFYILRVYSFLMVVWNISNHDSHLWSVEDLAWIIPYPAYSPQTFYQLFVLQVAIDVEEITTNQFVPHTVSQSCDLFGYVRNHVMPKVM